ncbi:MAG: phenylalanine 4-monooxygenase [Crocinitomicaceae bacterium]|nr:phenylalanine 4-monooxygenase [Crocinitomicaceae bacterium]
MKTYKIIEGLEQRYNQYTAEDRLVWKTLFERQMQQLNQVAHSSYLDGLENIGFSAYDIPDFREVNERLRKTTGWEIVVVPGIIDQPNFFNMLANKQFPSSTWLRKMEELDYLPEPDMFHDAFGHMPLLTNPTFNAFFQEIGEIGKQYIHLPRIVEMIGRIYWFTIEFGLIQSGKELQVYGAGIISSFGETKYSLSDVPAHLPFDVKTILRTDFDNTVIQDKYFIISSFDQLLASTREIKDELLKAINDVSVPK